MAKRTGEQIDLDDPRALRAYAHPIRLRLVGLLRQEGPLTATQAAELLGESSGTASFHLRQLAKYGLVEETGDGIGRNKPWRATAQFTHLPKVDTPELAEASSYLRRSIARRYHELLLDWIARRSTEPKRWQQAASTSDYLLYLTAAELDQLGRAVEELLLPYARRTERPPGSRLVSFITLGLPARR